MCHDSVRLAPITAFNLNVTKYSVMLRDRFVSLGSCSSYMLVRVTSPAAEWQALSHRSRCIYISTA